MGDGINLPSLKFVQMSRHACAKRMKRFISHKMGLSERRGRGKVPKLVRNALRRVERGGFGLCYGYVMGLEGVLLYVDQSLHGLILPVSATEGHRLMWGKRG